MLCEKKLSGKMVTAFLLKKEGKTSSGTTSKMEDQLEEMSEEGLFCRHCGHYITSPDLRIVVNDRHQHTFFNPAGVVYEIGCFSAAAGCRQYGSPSSEFSWFAGFTWSLSLCAVCTSHLGWFFRSNDSAFFGLIVKNLTSS